MFKRSSLVYLRFFTIDIGLTLIALRLAKYLRESIPLGVHLDKPLEFSPWLYLIVPTIWIVVFVALNVYSPGRSLRYTQDLPIVWGAITGASLIFAGVAYLLFRELSRLLFLYFFLLDIAFLSSWRHLLPRFPTVARRLHGADRRVLLVGTGRVGEELGRAIAAYPAANLTLVGFVDENPKKEHQSCLGYPVLGGLEDVPRLVKEQDVQEIIFALLPDEKSALRSLVISLQSAAVNLWLVPDMFDLVFLRASAQEFDGIPIIGLREPAIDGLDRLIKRLFDLVVSALLLTILCPLLLVVAVLIKLDSPGPVLFRQRRVGEGGRIFWMVKFRSMVEGAENEEAWLQQHSEDGRWLFAKTPGDSRITRLGHFLRRTSLDELPQLINVLKGEMSLVGPRPELLWLMETYEPWQRRRLAVPQGMTGWWQVNGRMRRATPEQRVEDDLFYIRNYSLWLDLQILWKTIKAVIQGEGAF
jgi:exopolysaccharide biosynthesis polyprenyl glycosylphosphotransferase